MNVNAIKTADKYLGAALCCLLSPFREKGEFSRPNSILFIQVWGIGETILTLPTIKATRRTFPKAHIAVLATDRNRAVYDGASYIDQIIRVKLSVVDLLKNIIKYYGKFDVVVDMEEYLNISAVLGALLGRFSVGYANQLRSRLYDRTIIYSDDQHVALTYFDLVRQIGVKSVIRELVSVPTTKANAQFAQRLLKLYGLQKNDFLVGFGIGSAESSRCRKWPKARFASLADLLVRTYGAKIIFVGAPYEVTDVTETIELMHEKAKAFNFAGKTDVLQLFALIENMDLFIGNDSGPMHIAACQGVTTIGLFGPNLPERFGPFGKHNRTVYKGNVCAHSPCINVHLGHVPDCLFDRFSDKYQMCMKNIGVLDVLKVVKEVVKK